MIYYLDTNICIYHINNSNIKMSERIKSKSRRQFRIPSMVAAELLFGAEKSGRREENLRLYREFLSQFEIMPFDSVAAAHYGEIRAYLERIGQPIGYSDLVIASIVRSRGGVLVTANTGEFGRVPGLMVEDWTK
jgi:tRNA(fMet)-specific endonuclease VapC